MSDHGMMEKEEIFSKVLRAGRRTYFFDVRATKAGDYYLTITESKKFTNDDGSFHYKKHKIYLYKEDFSEFNEILREMTDYIIAEKGDEVISERHQKDFKKEDYSSNTNDDIAKDEESTSDSESAEKFTDINFEDI
ncbi:PUR family DNA/RNA-binding protein [Psychroserpens luteolus]|uniref:PUR family DNA/RNA-binding protein n=1 Tax=Psychroserpens luteolus TaxID=2855840 RepID=UPI001E4C2F4E|nr:PUR family DNA/RNA-binding protein [Psychroserpens luteolus]MCD2259687.1 PUR family DNA/RNA-binding protein [Psychroserpens luteolus]